MLSSLVFCVAVQPPPGGAASTKAIVENDAATAQWRVVITGGAGYVGSHTTHALARAGGFRILVIDNLESGHAEAVPEGVQLKVLALDDAAGVISTLQEFKPHALIDFAAYLDVAHSQSQPEEYVRNNVQNFKNVLDAMVASQCKLIIKSSTQATYGDAPQSMMPLHEEYNAEGADRFSAPNLADGSWNGSAASGPQLFDNFLAAYERIVRGKTWCSLRPSERTMLFTPRSVYGLSKLLDEVMLRKYAAHHHGMRWVSLRYGNVCGAEPSGYVGEAKRKPHTLMTLAMYSLLGKGKKKALHLYGRDYNTPDGTTVRDYVHPTDLAKAHLESLRYLLAGRESDIFNLGTGHGSSVLDVLRAVEEVSGLKVPVELMPRRQGDCAFSVLDISKARAVLGYEPQFNLTDMATSAWRWHSVHREAFRGLAAEGVPQNQGRTGKLEGRR